MSEQTLQLSAIRLDGGTQCRANLDTDHIATLAEAWEGGAVFPAVVVYYDGSNYWLADGFHRYHAAQQCGFLGLVAEVRSGTRSDAVKFALGANAAHGLRRTNADKRRAVEIALKEFPKLSNVELAKICAVNDKTVAACRPKNLGTSEVETRIGADGKTRKLPERKLTIEPAPEMTIRNLGGGVLVKEPASESGAMVLENGTMRRMSADEESAELGGERFTPAAPVEFCPSAKRAGEEAEKDSATLWTLKEIWENTRRLKTVWGKANKKDRAVFIEWIQRGR